MPKLPPQRITVKTQVDGEVVHDTDISVGVDGGFTVSLPAGMDESALEFHRTSELYRHLGLVYSHQKLRASGRELKVCVSFVRAAIENHYAVEITDEQVLAYKYFSGVHYWKREDGGVQPNGYCPEQTPGNWQGAPDHSSTGPQPKQYSVGLAAFAMVRKTFRRGANETVKIVRWQRADNWDYSDPRARLNAFNHLSADVHDGERGWNLIPYTPAACEFFLKVMLSLCRIDDKFTHFFSSKENIHKAIAQGGNPFLLK